MPGAGIAVTDGLASREISMQGDWNLIVTGHIVRVAKQDVDKTGRGQKFFYEFLVRPESVERPPGVALPTELLIRVKDVELQRITGEKLSVGDRVFMSARANGPSPTLFYMTAVKKLAAR